jgi:hypothetical protein
MTFRIAVFSITFLANMNFDRESFQETILNTIGSMGYSTERQCPWIMKQIFDSGRLASTPYKRPMTKAGFFKKYEYVYDEYYDCIICPNNQVLKYSTTNREGYRIYKSNPEICKSCPCLEKCTASKACLKIVTRHVWEDYMELAEDVRLSPKGKEIYAVNAAALCPAVDVVNCPYIDGIGVHM